jgi:methyl-accepting chemotaxis protein
MDRKDRRKTVMIDRRFQFRQVASYIVLNTAIMLAFGGLLYLFLNSEVEANLFSAHIRYKTMKEMLFPIVLTLSLLNVVVSSVFVAVFVLYASHRIAGPMHRLKAVLDEAAKGRLGSLDSIRDGDQLGDVFASVRTLTGRVGRDLAEMKAGFAEIRAAVEPDASPELLRRIEKVETIVARYQI